MKTSLLLCGLVLCAVGLAMVRADTHSALCGKRTTACMEVFQLRAKATNEEDAFCRLYNDFKKCEEQACPVRTDVEARAGQIAREVALKNSGVDCSHASHLVSAQAMPVLLLFIIGLFFGVF